MLRDLHDCLKVSRAISPVLATDDTALVSQIIDTRGFDSLEFLIATGVIDDANVTFAVLVEDGNDSGLSDNAAVADSSLLGTEAAAGFQFDDDNEVRKIGYRGGKRYVRLTITPTGNSANPAGALISAVAIQGHAHQEPVS